MKPDSLEKKAVKKLSDAINSAIAESIPVAEVIDELREMGFEPKINVKLEIALRLFDELSELDLEPALKLTEEDLETLKRMKIKVDQ